MARLYWPVLNGGWPRAVLISGVVATIAAINVRGIKLSSVVVNFFTVGKLLPLVAFVAVGVFFMDFERLRPDASVPVTDLATGALLLIFAYGGYETVPVPAGEARDPRRAVPFALIMTIVIVTIVMVLVQVVTLGTLEQATRTATPLADAAGVFMGAAGVLLLTIGATISTSGNSMGQALSGSRSLFALAEQRDVPRVFGYVHPRFRTPSNAIVFTCAVSLALALSGTFVTLAAASAISRLLVYVATAASVVLLRQPKYAGVVQPATFTLPLGPVIPAAAILISLSIIAGATRVQLLAGGGALAAGAVLYVIAIAGQRQR